MPFQNGRDAWVCKWKEPPEIYWRPEATNPDSKFNFLKNQTYYQGLEDEDCQ